MYARRFLLEHVAAVYPCKQRRCADQGCLSFNAKGRAVYVGRVKQQDGGPLSDTTICQQKGTAQVVVQVTVYQLGNACKGLRGVAQCLECQAELAGSFFLVQVATTECPSDHSIS